MEGASSSSATRSAMEENLEEMLHLDLKDEELDDVVIGKE